MAEKTQGHGYFRKKKWAKAWYQELQLQVL